MYAYPCVALQDHNITLDAHHAVIGDPNTAMLTLPLTQWARRRYILHLRGVSYSASLKLQLMLGSPVVAVMSKCQEFYHPALESQQHFVRLPTPVNFATAKPELDAIMESPGWEGAAERIGTAGREFVKQELGTEAVDCYWAAVLIRYGQLYTRLKAHGV
jgi:Glycosyl transferase family 90